MKIAVSATGKESTDLLDSRFGRCSYFQIFDMETKNIKCVENNGKSASGGAGIAAAQQLVDEGVDVIISWKIGPNAFEVFEKANIKMVSSETVSVESALEAYEQGKLDTISSAGPAHHGA